MKPAPPESTSWPLVSVILPTHNRLQLLRRAVASVLGQTDRRLELIIVDDASTDGTPGYLDALQTAEVRIRVVRNVSPMGGGGARNAGMKPSRGAWIAFIDDDDEWMPVKLERQLRLLGSNSNAIACSCSYIVRSATGASRIVKACATPTIEELLVHNSLGGASGCVCAAEVVKNIGGFDAKLEAAQDLDLWVRLRQQGEITVCPEPLVVHHAHAGPRITTNAHAQYRGIRRFYLKHRGLMTAATRRHRISYSCYVMSIQNTRRLGRRLRLLATAMANSSLTYAITFARRSAPLLIKDALAQAAPSRRAGEPCDIARSARNAGK